MFLNKLLAEAREWIPDLDPHAVLTAGAANLEAVAGAPQYLRLVREMYMSGIHEAFVFALVGASIALLFTFGMEWKNTIAIAEQNKATSSEDGQVIRAKI